LNPEVYYRFHKSPPIVLNLNKMNPEDNLTLYFPEIHSIIIFPTSLGIPSDLFPSVFPTTNLYAFIISPMRATCSFHLILDLITIIIFGRVYKL